jgi:hypothetical protein
MNTWLCAPAKISAHSLSAAATTLYLSSQILCRSRLPTDLGSLRAVLSSLGSDLTFGGMDGETRLYQDG